MSEVRRHERQTASGKRTTVRHHTRNTGSGGGGVGPGDDPPGTWYVEDGGDIYAVYPDGSTHRLPRETEKALPPPNVSELRPAESEPTAQEWWDADEPRQEEWMADDEPVIRDYGLNDAPPDRARDVPFGGPDEPNPAEDCALSGGKDDADEVEHEGHTFKVNRAPAYQPQGDHDFAEPGHSPAFAAMVAQNPSIAEGHGKLAKLRGAGYDGPVDQDGNPTDRKALKKARKALLREQAGLSWKFSNEPDRAKREAMQAQFRALHVKLKAVQDPRQVRREERARQANRDLYKKLSGE